MRDLDLHGLRVRLVRGGVAPRHVNRTLKELRHHFADLEEQALSEGRSATEAAARAAEQIGDPELIIEEALSRPELKSWAYRWPWGIYGIFPVMALALVVVGSVLAVFGLYESAENSSGLSQAAFASALYDQWLARASLETWPVFMIYLLPGIFASAVCIFAAKRDAPILWPTIGVFLILFLGFSYDLSVTPPPESDQLWWKIGAGVEYRPDRIVSMLLSLRVFRLLIPLILVLGPYYWWRQRQQEGSSS